MELDRPMFVRTRVKVGVLVLALLAIVGCLFASDGAAQSRPPASGQSSQTPSTQVQSTPAPSAPAPSNQRPGEAPAQTAPVATPSPAGTQPATDAAAPEGQARSAAPRRIDALFPKPLRDTVERLPAEIARLTKSVDRLQREDDKLEQLRPEIDRQVQATLTADEQLKPLIETVRRQLRALGDPPKPDHPPESRDIAAERARLTAALTELKGALKRNELTRVEAQQLIARIQSLRHENLRRDLRRRYEFPNRLQDWQTPAARFVGQIGTVAGNWWAGARDDLHWLFMILIAGLGLWWLLDSTRRRIVGHWLTEPLEAAKPAYLRRVRMAVRTFPVLIMPGLVTTFAVYGAFAVANLLHAEVGAMALPAVVALSIFLIARALATAILLPKATSWRLIGLPTSVARRYRSNLNRLAGVYCLDLWLNQVFSALYVPPLIQAAEALIANIAFAALLLRFAWISPTGGVGNQPTSRVSARLLERTVYWLRLPATITVFVIVAASLLGYLAFARFIAGQVMVLGLAAAVLLLGHLIARSITREPILLGSLGDATGGSGASRLWLSSGRNGVLLAILSGLLNLAVLAATMAFLLMSWGFSAAELTGWGRALLFGFEIGSFRISLLQLLLAAGLFIGVVVATRLLQGWLSRGVLNPERIDRGIANSVHSGIGYLGIALAALISVSFAGIDLSNVALIASALSIGIGFGLNAIASNFVSGLIMLIERPIKIGDWVVVGQHEGYVRHISVRATEIETFDRSSVIIPNSDFMTSAVQNWTHRNTMARITVNVGAAYNANPRRVVELLEKVAADSDLLLRYPAPVVDFLDFGASSLDFRIRAYVADVTTTLKTTTALRIAIFEAFRDAGIEIPYPQQDVHLRDLDGVREMVTEAMRRRTAPPDPKGGIMPGNDNADGS